MSLPDEFFKQDDQNKTPLAKWFVVLIIFLFITWIIWVVYNRNVKNEEIPNRPLTLEEKIEILDNLSSKVATTTFSDTKKKAILESLSKKVINVPVISDDEKLKILEGLR